MKIASGVRPSIVAKIATAFLTLVLSASAGTQAVAAITVLKNFTLIDGTGRAPVAGSSLIIGDDGRIAWVGPNDALKMPNGAKTVDLSGKYVMPGLIDAHVHVGIMHDQAQDISFYTRQNVEEDLRIFAAYGVTAVGIMGTDKDLIFDLRKAQRAGRPSMARIFTGGQGIVFKGSYGGVVGLNKPVSNPQEARQAVDEQAAKGVDFIKFWLDDERHTLPLKMPYDVSQAIIDEAHKHHLKAVVHLFYLQDAKKLVEQGVDGFAHSVRDQVADQSLLDAMKKRGTWQLASTLSREAAFTYIKMPFLDDSFITRGMTPDTLKLLRSPEKEKAVITAPLFPQYGAALQNAFVTFGKEIKAGVKFGMGTDSGPPGRFDGFNAHAELEFMVMAGASPMQAIVAATSGNAQWFGASDLGTIAPSKWADLVVLNGNPIADIRNTRAIAAVYIAGNSVPTIWQTCRGRPLNACAGGPQKAN